jgi:hypothetical protein
MSVAFVKQSAINSIVSNILMNEKYKHWKERIRSLYQIEMTVENADNVVRLFETLNVDAYNIYYNRKPLATIGYVKFSPQEFVTPIRLYKQIHCFNTQVNVTHVLIQENPFFRIMKDFENWLAWSILNETEEYNILPWEIQ